MLISVIHWLSIFIFVLSVLFVLKTAYSFIKVLWLKYGKVEESKWGSLLFGLSLSYIITMLIVGF